MPIMLLAFLWPVFSVISFLLGFMIGCCTRKLPVLGSRLPWTLHRGAILPADDPESAALAETNKRPPWLTGAAR
jgi:hypothetical protein